MMKFKLKLIWGVLSLLFFFGCDDSADGNGGGFTTVQSPIFTARPSSFNFPSVEIGQSSDFQTVEISNEGEAVLRLVDFNLQFNNNASYVLKLNDDVVFDSEGNTLPDAIDIAPEQSITLSLQYTGDAEGVGNSIRFQTNDADQRSVTLPIMGSTSAAELNVFNSSNG